MATTASCGVAVVAVAFSCGILEEALAISCVVVSVAMVVEPMVAVVFGRMLLDKLDVVRTERAAVKAAVVAAAAAVATAVEGRPASGKLEASCVST